MNRPTTQKMEACKGGEVEMILIDMPMPERCGVCFAMHTDEIGLESWCGIDETARDLYTADINTKRPEWCPLKEKEAQKFLLDESGKITPLPVVVRCKDCKNADYGTDEDGNRFMKCIGSVKCYGGTTPDFFCADGERKPSQTNAKKLCAGRALNDDLS